jgi:hypothetical protein
MKRSKSPKRRPGRPAGAKNKNVRSKKSPKKRSLKPCKLTKVRSSKTNRCRSRSKPGPKRKVGRPVGTKNKKRS